MFLGQFSQLMRSKGMEAEPEPAEIEKPPQKEKSEDAEQFLKSAQTQSFVRKWSLKKNQAGEKMYTKRGIVALLKTLFNNPKHEEDADVLMEAEELLSLLGGMDGLRGFLAGWKAKSEGIMRGIKSILGGS